jgi:hypothetical protein
LGCHPVAVVIQHVYRTWNWFPTKFTSGGLHEKHVVTTWNVGNHLSICLKTQGNEEKSVSRWPVAGPSEYWLLASSPASKVKTSIHTVQQIHSTTNTQYNKYTVQQIIHRTTNMHRTSYIDSKNTKTNTGIHLILKEKCYVTIMCLCFSNIKWNMGDWGKIYTNS